MELEIYWQMVKKQTALLVLALLLIQIIMLSQKNSFVENFNLKVVNQELISQINMYQKKVDVPSVKNKFVVVYCQNIDSITSVYTLGYCIDIYGIIVNPPQAFVLIDDKLVGFVFEGFSCFALSKNSLISLMKKYFPKDYDYYIKYGDFPPPITAREILWILTIRNGKLIKKEIIN